MTVNSGEKRPVSETIALAIIDSGAKVVTCVPGFGVNEVFTDFNRFAQLQNPVSFHEEVAFAIAHGAALTGARAATLMKSHGFAKAGNSVADSLCSGTTAGFLSVIFHDSSGVSSDSIFDTEAFLRGLGIPYQVADPGHIYRQIIDLFERSEKRRLPYALVVESYDVTQSEITQDRSIPELTSPKYQRDIVQHLLCPCFTDYQSNVLQYKNKDWDWTSIPRPAIPRLPDALPDKWRPVAALYANLFFIFRSIRASVVTGDTGVSSLFAFEPYNCVDITTYMGGSIPLAVGAYLGGHRNVWAVTGDFSFIAAGHLGLLEAKQRGIPLKVLILYNGKAETTGGQPIPENTLETVLAGYNKHLLFIKNPEDKGEIESVLMEAKRDSEMRIVIADLRKKN